MFNGIHLSDAHSPAARFRQARISKSMTIRDLSNASGYSETSISYIEGSKTKASLQSLRIFSRLLGVPIYVLGCFDKLPDGSLGEKLKKARMYHGMTKTEMAAQIGADVKSLTNWENDKHIPSHQHRNSIDSLIQASHF